MCSSGQVGGRHAFGTGAVADIWDVHVESGVNYDPMLGEPFRARPKYIMTLGPIRVTGSRDELAASSLDTNRASAKRRYA
jgi:hypothetical protein